jgi:hypothetical protein
MKKGTSFLMCQGIGLLMQKVRSPAILHGVWQWGLAGLYAVALAGLIALKTIAPPRMNGIVGKDLCAICGGIKCVVRMLGAVPMMGVTTHATPHTVVALGALPHAGVHAMPNV